MYNYSIKRKNTKVVNVGNVLVGGNNPISVQSMTNTDTVNVNATVNQILQLQQAGADIVRVSVPDVQSSTALKQIVKQVSVPIVADIHFHYRRAIESAQAGASCLRINPGNIGNKQKVMDVVKAAKDYNCSVRIGVNAGSLEDHLIQKYKSPTAQAMLESAMLHAKILEDCDFTNFKISVKASNVFLATQAYTLLSNACNYPLHLGITESGTLKSGTVVSSIGLGYLLMQGIGDTIRVSLSANPIEEVKVGFEMLKALNIRSRGVKIIACPSCARQGFDVVKTVAQIEQQLEHITTPITISILGCVVNGIGEAMHSNIGIVGIGDVNSRTKENVIYINGKKDHKVGNENLVEHVVQLVNNYVGGSNV